MKKLKATLAALIAVVGVAAVPQAASASTYQQLYEDSAYTMNYDPPGWESSSWISTFSGGYYFAYSWSGSGWGVLPPNCSVDFIAHNLSNGYVFDAHFDDSHYSAGGPETVYIGAVGTNRWQWTLDVSGHECYGHEIAYRYY